MVIIMIATGCEKDCDCDLHDPQLKIRITDIPTEYEGKYVITHLGTIDNLYHRAHNYNQNIIVMYGEVTTKLRETFDYADTPFTEKGEYRLTIWIFDYNNSGDYNFFWTGESRDIIKITKETTTISFNALTKWE